MKNFRKNVLFFILSSFIILSSVPVRAETVEEKKEAANYDETLPASGEAQRGEEASPVPQASPEAPPAQPVVPGSSVEKETPKTVSEVPTAPSSRVTPQEMPEDQVFTDSKPSGLVEVSGYKYPVYLFAPKDYKTDRTYAMVMMAPAESMKAEKQIEYLTGLAQRSSIFVLAPYVLWPKAGDTPYALDQWLLTVKKDVMERFPISKKRTYLVGKDSGAQYAAYFAMKYPKEFAAVTLLGEAWEGPFALLVQPRANAGEQLPFYIALKAGGDARSRNQVWFDKLQEKGYPLHLVDYKNDEELDDLEFKKSFFSWMEETGQSWQASAAQAPKTWKGKFKKGVKDFFAV